MELTDEEIEGALALMDSMTRDDLDDPEFRDAYTEAVEQIIEAKREHREPPKLEEPEEKTGQLLASAASATGSTGLESHTVTWTTPASMRISIHAGPGACLYALVTSSLGGRT